MLSLSSFTPPSHFSLATPEFPWFISDLLVKHNTADSLQSLFAFSIYMNFPVEFLIGNIPEPPYSHGHLPVITGYKWDYTFYKWGYKYL